MTLLSKATDPTEALSQLGHRFNNDIGMIYSLFEKIKRKNVEADELHAALQKIDDCLAGIIGRLAIAAFQLDKHGHNDTVEFLLRCKDKFLQCDSSSRSEIEKCHSYFTNH